jgi:hypothetical protein
MTLLVWIAVAWGSPIEDGLRAWDDGDLAGAIEAWQAPLEEGRGSAAIHTNLGVAWYRHGDAARALAHWKMARLLAPRASDPAHNLAVVRSEIEGVPLPPPAWPASLQMATVGEWGGLGALLLFLASVGAWVAKLKRFAWWPWLAVAGFGALVGAVAVHAAWEVQHRPLAVVVGRDLVLRVDPEPSAPAVRTLPPGAELRVERTFGDFVLVSTGDGGQGWTSRASIAVIGPELSLPSTR